MQACGPLPPPPSFSLWLDFRKSSRRASEHSPAVGMWHLANGRAGWRAASGERTGANTVKAKDLSNGPEHGYYQQPQEFFAHTISSLSPEVCSVQLKPRTASKHLHLRREHINNTTTLHRSTTRVGGGGRRSQACAIFQDVGRRLISTGLYPFTGWKVGSFACSKEGTTVRERHRDAFLDATESD